MNYIELIVWINKIKILYGHRCVLILNVRIRFIDDIKLHTYCDAYPHKLNVWRSGNGFKQSLYYINNFINEKYFQRRPSTKCQTRSTYISITCFHMIIVNFLEFFNVDFARKSIQFGNRHDRRLSTRQQLRSDCYKLLYTIIICFRTCLEINLIIIIVVLHRYCLYCLSAITSVTIGSITLSWLFVITLKVQTDRH